MREKTTNEEDNGHNAINPLFVVKQPCLHLLRVVKKVVLLCILCKINNDDSLASTASVFIKCASTLSFYLNNAMNKRLVNRVTMCSFEY